MNILGINSFHPDASACLVINGQLVGAVAEERLGKRIKHNNAFPVEAIRWLLDSTNLRLREIDYVAVARDPRANLAAKSCSIIANPTEGLRKISTFRKRQKNLGASLKTLPELLGEDPATIRYKRHAVEHHLAHIASAYYLSPFDEVTAGFSYDGSGDFASGMAARCEGTQIEVLDRITLPNSLGHFYSALCQFIGFDHFGEEYKVMGLAPYGADNYHEQVSKVLCLAGTDWFELNRKYFQFSGSTAEVNDEAEFFELSHIFSDELIRLLGEPRDRGDAITQREKDIARSTQVRFEEAAAQCIRSLSARVPINRLAMAGGCALNGVMNARIDREFPVDRMWLHPAASDDGTAIGAAYHCWHQLLGRKERFTMQHAFWGPEYSESRIRSVIRGAGLDEREANSEEDLLAVTADLIAGGAVVGWYQGRSEWGPRALGNRSILANPAIPDMKATINEKIKKRESFRPFAPSVLREEVSRYFEQDVESPFMMHVVKFRPEWRETFPAVTHVDGTGRLQTVEEANNPLYYRLIRAVRDRTGHGIVLNTSFNENEPVVDTPEQALACFLRTDMDALIMGQHVLRKTQQEET